MKIAIYPGSFDPITNGHLDILKRGAKIFDKVVIAIADNMRKESYFSVEKRLELIEGCTTDLDNVEIDRFKGLLVDYAKKVKASVIIRGLRQVSDFEYEFQMALMNRQLNDNIDTIFLMPHEKYTYLSSSVVREITKLNGDISRFVPENVLKELRNKYGSK
ncbi:MAG: pantetheine-phosphate adenylyltransferase [Candidatus Marinimicrobia bacterium]|nr:pantetheine-phosphate adenylyltransferase [Candidatus Neomarinimicrobiota bacterium]